MTYEKPITIDLTDFEEELLPSGRKLLHLIFKQKFGTSHYKWTPPWKGDCGVERLFFKALEVEEWNDYEGVWSKELRQASKEIPSLDEIRLPVKVGVGEMSGPMQTSEWLLEDTYRVTIELLSDEQLVWKDELHKQSLICIGEVKISWDFLKQFLLKMPVIRAVSKEVETVTEPNMWDGQGNPMHWEDIGVRFYVWLEAGAEKKSIPSYW